MDESVLQAGICRAPLYLEKRLARGQSAAPVDRGTTRATERPPALGQAVYDATSATAIALREAAGVSTIAGHLRSAGQIPQCVPGYVYLWSELIDSPKVPAFPIVPCVPTDRNYWEIQELSS